MLSARVLVGFCIFSACALADDSTMNGYLDLQMSRESQPPLTLFDGTFTLTPVKPDSALLPVNSAVPRRSRRPTIQQMSFTTESNPEFVPMETVYVETGSDGTAPVDIVAVQDVPPVTQTEHFLSSDQALLRRLQIQDEQIAALQSQIHIAPFGSPVAMQPLPYVAGCGEDCGENCRSESGMLCGRCGGGPRIIGGVEIPFLRTRLSGVIPVFNVGAAAERMIDSSFEPSIRYHFELQGGESHSVRARHFRYDQSFPFQAPYRPAQLGVEINQTDVEAVFRHRFHRWSFDVSGGVEHARLEYQSDLPTAVGVGSASFEGVGPVFALNAAHDVGNTNLSWFCGVRASILMGRINNETLLVNVPQAEILDETMQVYSNQLGVQWAPLLSNPIGLTIRAAWETQYWVNSTFSDDALGIGSNLNLTGPTISAQIDY